MKETVVLHGKKELDIYMNPQRQNLIRCMKIEGEPLTPKQLSVKLGISASSVQHHLKKLAELGLVEVSYTRQIKGITASYYSLLPKTVAIGGELKDENFNQRLVIMQNALSSAFDGFAKYSSAAAGLQEGRQHGDVLSGVVHLSNKDAKELYTLVRTFLEEHETKEKGCIPWEYSMVFYPAGEEDA